MENSRSREFLLKILGIHILFYAVVLFNIPVARQVIGFMYLTFVPGIVISRLLKLGSFSWYRRTIFSTGFSIAFLMFSGLLINTVGPAIGISQPLSLIPLVATLSPAVLLLAFISYFREDVHYLASAPISINRKFVLSVALPLCLPVVAVVGALLMNFSGNNSILLLLIAMISVCVSVSILVKKLVSPKIYVLIVLMIALALLFHSALVSNYIWGNDIQLEYYVFNLTESNKFWAPNLPMFWDLTYGRFNSMLSITILPTIYSSVLAMDPTWVLKIVYPLVFSLVPVGLFLLWKPYIGSKRSFFAVFLFVAQSTFYTEMVTLDRQIVGELFLVLLFMVLLSRKMGQFNRNLCFIVFGAALVVSHYALSYLFMFFILFEWGIHQYFVKKISKVNLIKVISFFVIAFSWYIYTSNAGSFETFLSFGNNVLSSIGEFANLGSRSEGVLIGLGLASSPTLLNTVSRIIAYVIEIFIVLGFLALVTKQTKLGFNRNYIAFAWVSMSLLAASILLPGFSDTLRVERFFHISLFFLAPFCVIGAEYLYGVLTDLSSNWKFKLHQKLGRKMRRKPAIYLCAILVLYLLFQTNFLYEIAGSESWSIPLSKQRLDPILLYTNYAYIEGSDVAGTKWLVNNIDFNHTTLYADLPSIYNPLTSYGMIYRNYVKPIYNVTQVTTNGTIYLSRLNVVYGLMIIGNNLDNVGNTSDVFSTWDNINKICTNGACEIYQKSG
jgi:uncharacterized membrane protein